MRHPYRGIGLITLVALFFTLSTQVMLAQEEPITAVGSGLSTPILEAASAETGQDVTVEVTGTTSGFQAFCAGTADIATATRALEANEELPCTANSIQFHEFLIGYNILAFVSSPESSFNQCIATLELNALLAPSAEGTVTDWSLVNATNPSAPVVIYLPNTTTSEYALLDTLVEGDGFRSDALSLEDASVTDVVTADPNALVITSLAQASLLGDDVRVLQYNSTAAGCTSPTAQNVDDGLYTAANNIYVYVNAASLSKAGMTEVIDSLLGGTLAEASYTVPAESVSAENAEILANETVGRVFSRERATFTPASQILGTIQVQGAGSAQPYFSAVSSAFTGTYATVTVTSTFQGTEAGLRNLCSNATDIVLTHTAVTDETLAACAETNVVVETFPLGFQTVVLVGNGASDYLTCMTTEQLLTTWSAASAGTVETWNQVDASFPETALTLFQPSEHSLTADLLMAQLSEATVSNRVDGEPAQFNAAPLFRAAAIANVEGALGYFTWAEYQQIVESNQANVQLVGVDAGDGCVTPSEATIADGSYVLTQPLTLLVSQSALGRPEVQSLLWYLADDFNFAQFTAANIVGVSYGSLNNLREALVVAFDAANTAALVEVTPEATAEAGDASAEATEEAPVEATTEATPEATETEEATVEVEPTEEATPES